MLAVLARDLWRRFNLSADRFLPAAALAAIVAMLTAGLFEYNFGDSEFLMLFLIIVTLPFTANVQNGGGLTPHAAVVGSDGHA